MYHKQTEMEIEKPNLKGHIGFVLALPLLLLNRLQPLRKLGITVERLFKFLVVGGASAVVGLGSLYLLTDIAHIHYLISNVIAFVASTLVWFYWHKAWTFKDKRSHLGLLKSFPTKLVVLGIEEGILVLLVEVCGLWYMTSAVIAIAVGAPLSYLLSIKWIWNKQ